MCILTFWLWFRLYTGSKLHFLKNEAIHHDLHSQNCVWVDTYGLTLLYQSSIRSRNDCFTLGINCVMEA